ncbi:MAG: Osmosensitive channel histidine kinaselike protein [Acidimicrobiales bacterium]|nr:Osmosensitive channel histidine kinaselike protein [Acidimicrobiales bacterium]
MDDDDDRASSIFWLGLGPLAAIVVAAALVAARNVLSHADVGLILVLVVVVVAASSDRRATVATAILAATSFDFFQTKPYDQLGIASREDIITTLLLLAVGLAVGQIVSERRSAARSADRRGDEIRRIRRVADLAAKGHAASDVIMGAQAELLDLLHLVDCRFESAPFTPPMPRLERSGSMRLDEYHARGRGFELPAAGVELAVLGRGHLLGRFVLHPVPATGVALEERVVAVAIADQVGAMLAAPQPGATGRVDG